MKFIILDFLLNLESRIEIKVDSNFKANLKDLYMRGRFRCKTKSQAYKGCKVFESLSNKILL
jgi:hypothetical protein